MSDWLEQLQRRSMTCEKCGHENHQVRNLQMVEIPEFRDMLSEKAKLTYDKRVNSTVIQTVTCLTCQTEFVDDRPWGERTMLSMMGKSIDPPEHKGHDLWLNARQVMYLMGAVDVPLPLSLITDHDQHVRREILRVAKGMAYAVNRCIDAGMLSVASLTGCFVTNLATVDLRSRYQICYFVASKYPKDGLNHFLGADLFKTEGEIGDAEVWQKWIAQNL